MVRETKIVNLKVNLFLVLKYLKYNFNHSYILDIVLYNKNQVEILQFMLQIFFLLVSNLAII